MQLSEDVAGYLSTKDNRAPESKRPVGGVGDRNLGGTDGMRCDAMQIRSVAFQTAPSGGGPNVMITADGEPGQK